MTSLHLYFKGPLRGRCDCGKCKCTKDWEGRTCECTKKQDTCRPAEGVFIRLLLLQIVK